MGRKGGYGNVIQIDHGRGIRTVYGHMSRFGKSMRVGRKVSQGDTIGYVGMTGLATGPHLHYEYLVNGTQRNPAKIALPRSEIPARYLPEFRTASSEALAKLELANGSGVRLASTD
jgi:murein DD-endopeptidase MepM/ murein hydrolase activator NlpD